MRTRATCTCAPGGRISEAFEAARTPGSPATVRACYVLGEVYGRGVQDLHYGKPNPDFAVFDAYVGEPGTGAAT